MQARPKLREPYSSPAYRLVAAQRVPLSIHESISMTRVSDRRLTAFESLLRLRGAQARSEA